MNKDGRVLTQNHSRSDLGQARRWALLVGAFSLTVASASMSATPPGAGAVIPVDDVTVKVNGIGIGGCSLQEARASRDTARQGRIVAAAAHSPRLRSAAVEPQPADPKF
jgi:hypothetical protein